MEHQQGNQPQGQQKQQKEIQNSLQQRPQQVSSKKQLPTPVQQQQGQEQEQLPTQEPQQAEQPPKPESDKQFVPLTECSYSETFLRDYAMFAKNAIAANKAEANDTADTGVLEYKRKMKPENMSNVERYRELRDKYFKLSEKQKQKYRNMTPCCKKTKSKQTQSESESEEDCPPKKLEGVRRYRPRKKPTQSCPPSKGKRITKPRAPKRAKSNSSCRKPACKRK